VDAERRAARSAETACKTDRVTVCWAYIASRVFQLLGFSCWVFRTVAC
jgi:hypothetical protein